MKKFWNWIKNSNDTRILRLEGPIDEESFWGDEITPQMFRDELESGEGDVTVWINSPGGNVFAAAEIYTMLRDYKGSITVKIDAIAASAASVVAMAGDTVQMSLVAMLMIHDPSTVAIGNTKDMEKAIEVLTEVKESIINAYAAKSGLSHARIANLMSNETWMNAKKAVELGFVDEILVTYTGVANGYTDERSLKATGEDTGEYLEKYSYSYPIWRCKRKMGEREDEPPKNGTPDQKIYSRSKKGCMSNAEKEAADKRCPSEIYHECALEQSFMELLYSMK